MKITWGHGVIIALGAFILFILGMIFFFPNGQQNSELITDDYYEEELKYQDVIDAKNKADQLTEKPSVILNKSGIEIVFPKAFSNQNTKFNFYLFRTNDKNLDVQKDFTLDSSNKHLIPASVISPGNYTLKLKWTSNKTQYQRDFDIQWK